MRQSLALIALFVANPVFAATECTPVSQSHPASISISARNGLDTISLPYLLAIGNPGSPTQPSEAFVINAGKTSFTITPVASCPTGMKIRFGTTGSTMEGLVPWGIDKAVIGKAGSEYFVIVRANRIGD